MVRVRQTFFAQNPWESRVGLGFYPGSQVRLAGLGQALKCWRTDDGGAVCSNLKYYSPACPSTPPITESEIAPTPPEAPGAT